MRVLTHLLYFIHYTVTIKVFP